MSIESVLNEENALLLEMLREDKKLYRYIIYFPKSRKGAPIRVGVLE